MNKTVTINISGIIFHIEEDAYEALSKYLSTIKSYFSNTDGGNEIMSDIEARIAEMLQNKTNTVKQVVLMSDVEDVMNNMGKPEDFASENETSNDTQFEKNTSGYDRTVKRLYRDGDSKVLGGVCSGVGHYFGFDPVWLRIALLLLFFFAGTGFLIYLILWIAIPEAKTTAEKLAMKGEKADINNISKTVKEEAEQLKKRMEKYGNDIKNMASNHYQAPRNAVEKTVDFITDIFTYLGKAILKIIAILMVIFGILFFLGLSGSIFGFTFIENASGSEWIDLFLLTRTDFYLGILGIILFVGIPIIMLIYTGVRLLFKLPYNNRWINLTAGIFWITGLIILFFLGIKTSTDFNITAKNRESIEIIPHDTLLLSMHQTPVNNTEMIESDEDQVDDKGFKFNYRSDNDYTIGIDANHNTYLLGHAQLNIIKSQNNQIELVVIKEAKGKDKLAANERAKNISYTVNQNENNIQFDNLFKVNNADKFRFQDLKVILKLPVGKVVYLDNSLKNLIYDIENLTNTYDGDMVNRRWKMTEYGLACVDCDGLVSVKDHEKQNEDEDSEDEDTKEVVNINVNGVNVKANDAKVKIDSTGVHIQTNKK